MMKRAWSILLALTLLVTPAMASQAMGWELVRSETVVGPGVTVTTQKLWGDSRSDYRTEQFVTYTPGGSVSPAVVYGGNVPAKSTLTAMAQSLEQSGKRVLAGANGDYFVVATGVPLGLVVTDGVLRSSSSYHYAVGFDAQGGAFVGKPGLTVWTDIKGQHLAAMGGYNKTREAAGGMTLFNQDFGAATKGAGEGINVILRPVVVPADYVEPVYQAPDVTAPTDPSQAVDPATGAPVVPTEEETAAYQEALAAYQAALDAAQAAYETALAASAANLATAPDRLVVGGEGVTCVVTGVSTLSGSVAIPRGCFILTLGKDSGEYFQNQLSALKVGERIKLSVTAADPRWNDAQQAIGAYQMLLKDGVVQEGLDNTANPRTALGIKANGQVILYTMDGRRAGYSVGASMRQVAARLKELGCVDAVLFDGGGSTTFGTTGALDNAFTLQNKPSDGSQRAVTNALFFVSDRKATGELGSLYVSAPDNLFLPGGRTTLTAQGIDTGYHPMNTTYSDVTYSVAGPGTVTGNVFTAAAAAEKTEAVVTATAPGGQQGSVILTVVPTPHGITVANQATAQAVTSLNLEPGQAVDLTASADWYGLSLTAADESFTWSVSPEVGTVDAAGKLTAGSKAAAGTVTVTAGAKTVTLPVTVGGHVNLLEPWEEGSTLPAVDPEGFLHTELTGTQVRYGKSSLKVEYLTGTEAGVLPLELPLAVGESDVGFWVYPTEEVTLAIRVALTDGSEATVPCNLGAPGHWSFVRADLPAGTAKVTGLTITPAPYDPGYVPSDVIIPGGVAWATLYLDHFTSTNGGISDQTPPTVKLTCTPEGAVTATLSDNVDKTFDKARISLTLDGKPVDFALTGNTVTAQVEEDRIWIHRISITVSDASGNLARASFQTEAQREAWGTPLPPVFEDTVDHWARDYTDYLYGQKVINGIPTRLGTLRFQPGDNITRGDFVTMLMRWLGTDLSQYESVALPFEDLAAIQPWALSSIRAAYFLNIFNGSGEADALYANALEPITRVQAMALLGRVQAKGYAPSAETFLDQNDIPAWAADHVSTLVAQGVISGYGGYVRPNDPITRAEVAKVLTVMW